MEADPPVTASTAAFRITVDQACAVFADGTLSDPTEEKDSTAEPVHG
jgi:hypothetical protein